MSPRDPRIGEGESERAHEADLEVARRLKDLALQVDPKGIRRIILFGSRARGDAQPDSDFDLLVVVRQIAPDQKRAYRRSLSRAVRGSGVSAESWVMSEEEYEESKTVIGSLAYPAWSEGVLLYENA